MAISKKLQGKFDELLVGFEHRQVCLLEVIDSITGAPAAVLCVRWLETEQDGTSSECFAPIARMIEGDPFEQFDRPDAMERYAVDGVAIIDNAMSVILVEVDPSELSS